MLAAIVPAAASGQRPAPRSARGIAITIDDLPKVVPPPARAEDTNQIYLSLVRIITALRAHQAPATGFVVGKNVEGGDTAARTAMLRRWLNAGLTLGNHSYSHPNLCESSGNSFALDVVRGDAVLRKITGALPGPTYFRLPYLCTGRSRVEKQDFAAFLEQHGWTNAPVTIATGDYMFNELYLVARARSDLALQRRVRAEYVARVGALLDYFAQQSQQLFGREIPQILLIHSNDLNVDCLDDVLRLIEQRGYRFVTLDEALADPAYRTPDDYIGTLGISWLHRWKVALGKPFDYSTEPRIPGWLVYEVEKLHETP